MRQFIALILALVMVFALLPAGISLADSSYDTIRVKLSTNNATALSIYVSGEYFIQENGASFSGGTLTVRSNLDGTLTLYHSSLGSLYAGVSLHLMRAKMDKSAGYLQLNGYRYLGHFYIAPLSSGYLRVINEVPLAHYLYGVVAYEMSDSFPMEALKAQAIAAKCYALSLRSSGDYDIGDTSSDQVYRGYYAGYSNVIAAVDSTIQEVLTVNGKLLCTYYAASNGGETMLPSQAWSGRSSSGYAVVQDPYDLRNVYAKKETVTVPLNRGGSISQGLWNLLLTKASAATGQSCTALYNIAQFSLHTPRFSGQTRNMTAGTAVVSVYTAGNTLLENITVNFTTQELEAYQVVLDSSLRIFWGEQAADGSAYYIYHLRYGHGVGLSQRGAQQAASEGLSYRDILKFYYPGATLSTISVQMPADPARPNGSQPAGDYVLARTTGGVNLRVGPGVTYTSLGVIPADAQLQVFSREGGWARVAYGSYAGYVSEDYIAYDNGYPPNSGATPSPSASPVPSPTPEGSAAPGVIAYGQVTGQGVNFRTGPSTLYESLCKLDRNTPLSIYGQENGWYRAQANGQNGYIIGSYVRITGYPSYVPEVDTPLQPSLPLSTPSPSAQPTATPDVSSGYTAVETGLLNAGGVNFRKGPDTSFASYGKLDKNTGVFVLGRDGDWYYVQIGQTKGYVYDSYITITGTARIDSQGNVEGAPPQGSTGLGKTTGNVYLRQGPGTSHEALDILRKGAEVILYEMESGWYKVKLEDGTAGYVSSKYITVTQSYNDAMEDLFQPDEPSKPQSTGKGVATTDVNFREGPSTSHKKLGRIPEGASLILYGQDGDWQQVEYNGIMGYVYGKYVKKTSADQQETVGTPDTPVSSSTLRLAQGSAGGKVNFRKAPSTQAEKIQLLSKGTELQILGQWDEWYYVLYKGQAGFAFKDYIRVESQGDAGIPQVNANIQPRACTTSAQVNLRAGANTDSAVIKLLDRRSEITVYYVQGDWCLANYQGTLGYVFSEYVNFG